MSREDTYKVGRPGAAPESEQPRAPAPTDHGKIRAGQTYRTLIIIGALMLVGLIVFVHLIVIYRS